MADQHTIRLTGDEALVLSHWLDQVMGTPTFDQLVNQDRAVWAPLYRIAGTLDKAIPEIFAADYSGRLDAARERILARLGEGQSGDSSDQRS